VVAKFRRKQEKREKKKQKREKRRLEALAVAAEEAEDAVPEVRRGLRGGSPALRGFGGFRVGPGAAARLLPTLRFPSGERH